MKVTQEIRAAAEPGKQAPAEHTSITVTTTKHSSLDRGTFDRARARRAPGVRGRGGCVVAAAGPGHLRDPAPGRRPGYAARVGASLVAESAFILLARPVPGAMGKDAGAVVRITATLIAGPEVMQPPGWVPGDILLGLTMHGVDGLGFGWAYRRMAR